MSPELEEFQKRSRTLRKSRNKVEILHLVELSKRGGAHDSKGGNSHKRSQRRKFADREIAQQLRDYDDNY